jgi:hypothetical protein
VSHPASAVKDEYEDAARIGLRNACKDAEARYDLPEGTLLAIASRETNMRNIVGDHGHGRGVFQIDDRWHADWLRKHGAGGPNETPPVRDAAFYAASLLAANLDAAKDAGVPKDERMRVALAAYNTGFDDAIVGWRAGNPDARTTGQDYSRDVLQRRAVVRDLLPDGNDDDGNRIVIVGPAGGVVAPTSNEKVVINPEHLRSMANLLDRADDSFKDFAHRLATLRKPNLPHSVELHVAAEIAGINVRLRALAPPAHAWAVDLRKRASRVEDPAGGGRGGRGRRPVKYRNRLSIGSQGAQVRTLQRLLNKLGFGPLDVDGIFGPLTQAALRRFQAKRKLDVNGVAGDKTWEALLGHKITIKAPASGGAGAGGGALPKGFSGELERIIRTQVGTINQGSYDMANKYTRDLGRGAEAWCADFVSWAFKKAGHDVGVKPAVSQWVDYFKAKGDWHTAPRVGAVVCFDWPGRGGYTDHVGIVSRIEGDRVYYISGNTSNPGGSGVGVYEKSVPLGAVIGYGWTS